MRAAFPPRFGSMPASLSMKPPSTASPPPPNCWMKILFATNSSRPARRALSGRSTLLAEFTTQTRSAHNYRLQPRMAVISRAMTISLPRHRRRQGPSLRGRPYRRPRGRRCHPQGRPEGLGGRRGGQLRQLGDRRLLPGQWRRLLVRRPRPSPIFVLTGRLVQARAGPARRISPSLSLTYAWRLEPAPGVATPVTSRIIGTARPVPGGSGAAAAEDG